jgi:hypothetical protein
MSARVLHQSGMVKSRTSNPEYGIQNSNRVRFGFVPLTPWLRATSFERDLVSDGYPKLPIKEGWDRRISWFEL